MVKDPADHLIEHCLSEIAEFPQRLREILQKPVSRLSEEERQIYVREVLGRETEIVKSIQSALTNPETREKCKRRLLEKSDWAVIDDLAAKAMLKEAPGDLLESQKPTRDDASTSKAGPRNEATPAEDLASSEGEKAIGALSGNVAGPVEAKHLIVPEKTSDLAHVAEKEEPAQAPGRAPHGQLGQEEIINASDDVGKSEIFPLDKVAPGSDRELPGKIGPLAPYEPISTPGMAADNAMIARIDERMPAPPTVLMKIVDHRPELDRAQVPPWIPLPP